MVAVDPYLAQVRSLEGLRDVPDGTLARVAIGGRPATRWVRALALGSLTCLPVAQTTRAYAWADRRLGLRILVIDDDRLQVWRPVASTNDRASAFGITESWPVHAVTTATRIATVRLHAGDQVFSMYRHQGAPLARAVEPTPRAQGHASSDDEP